MLRNIKQFIHGIEPAVIEQTVTQTTVFVSTNVMRLIPPLPISKKIFEDTILKLSKILWGAVLLFLHLINN